MKTKEFIKQVEVMGYEVFCERSHTRVFTEDDAYSTYLLASIGEEYERAINTFTECGGHGKVFDLVIEYARTPLEERKEQPSYTIVADSGKIIECHIAAVNGNWCGGTITLPTTDKKIAEAVALLTGWEVCEVTDD